MSLIITADEVGRIAPGVKGAERAKIAAALDTAWRRYDLMTPRRIHHFLGRVLHESDGFRIIRESMTYRDPDRIVAIFGPKRHSAKITAAEAPSFVGQPEKLAERVYGFDSPDPKQRLRKSLGNRKRGDAFNYRGGGWVQITGLDDYERATSTIGKEFGVDFVANPDLVADPRFAALIACEEWTVQRASRAADRDDVEGVCRAINGGTNGLADQKRRLALVREVIPERVLAERLGQAANDDDPAPVPRPKPAQATSKGLIEAAQRALTSKGYAPGGVDGEIGTLTRGAVAAWQIDNDRESDGIITVELVEAIENGPDRPLAPARANATAADVAKTNSPAAAVVKDASAAEVASYTTAVLAGAKGVAEAVAPAAEPTKSVIEKAADKAAEVKTLTTTTVEIVQAIGAYWWLPIVGLALFVAWKNRGAIRAAVAGHRTGSTT